MSAPLDPNRIKRVTAEELRRRFNEGRYWAKVQNGEWSAQVIESHPSLLLDTEAVPIRSEIVSYFDSNGMERARIHQFVRPDGSLAASGLPDPKRIFDAEQDVWYRLQRKQRK